MQLVRGMFWPTQIGYLLGKKGLHYSNAPFYTLPHDLCWPKHIHYKRAKHVGLGEAYSTSFVLIIIIYNALLKCLNVNIDLLAKKLEDPLFSKNVVIKLSSFKSSSLSNQTNFLTHRALTLRKILQAAMQFCLSYSPQLQSQYEF